MDENVPGYRVSNAKPGDKIQLTGYSEEQIVKCSVQRFKFSAHSNRDGLLEIVKKLRPEKIILVHGDEQAIRWIGNAVLKDFKEIKVFQAELGKEIEI